MAASPGSDNNCNIYMPPIGICSVASSHDFSDYQWLSDFGSYRDGAPTHQSILSALSASYNGIGELSYYEKMAKDIDANLAEIDMESFRTEDMHSLLTGLPPAGQQKHQQLLVDDVERKTRNNNRIFSATSNGGCTGTGLITVDMMDNSICKSELLFSPVKESHISVDSLDMDGYPDEEDIILTCQANKNNYTIAFEQSVLYSDESFYDGPENYGKYKRMNLLNNLQSCSQFFKNKESAMSHSEVGYTTWSKVKRNGPAQRVPIAINPLISHISRHARTCFVRKSLSMPNLQENQISQNQSPTHHALPNGQQPLNVSQAANTGTGAAATEPYDRPMRTLLPMYTLPTDSENESTHNEGCGDARKGTDSSHDRCEQSGQQQHEDDQHQQHQQHQQQQPSFNLVKLFIKQKSSSTDTCMDVSSGCWPSDSTNESGGSTGDQHHHHHPQQQQRLGGRIKKNSMNDSGKCSSTMLGGPNATDNDEDDREEDDEEDEEEFQLDSLDAQINNLNNNAAGNEDAAAGVISAARRAAAVGGPLAQAKLNDFNRQMPCSPRRQYKGYNMNIGGRKGMGGKIPSTIHSSTSSGMAGSPQSSINSGHHHHHAHNQSNNHGNNVNNNNSYKDTNSDASRTSENLTQIFNHSGNNNTTTTRHSTKTVPLEMITKSMQTSLTVSGAPGTTIGAEKVRVIPPSFLDRLNELGDRQKAPVFVVYPNYVLPDLGFLKPQSNEVVLSPLSFRETMSTAGGGKGATLLGPTRKARPVSLNDIETIKQREYRHVADWKSLVFLLPTDYRKLLRHIPEVSELAISTESRPMFCQTPPLRRAGGAGGGIGGARGMITCDCMTLLQQNTQTYASSSSGGSSSAAPSSGYRGSSTMLTTGDSEMDLLGPSVANGGTGAGNGLYVYQYDSPAEVLGSFDRPPSGRLGGAGPKSILRRPKAKRNSMFEEEQSMGGTGADHHHAPSPSSSGVREKRRSLQEHHSYNFYEEEEAERTEQKLHNSPNMTPHPRLANTPKLPSADHYHKLNKLVELSERELLAAGGGDGPAAAHGGGHSTEEELEARARAEHFLSHVPRAELKHYAEIAHILESTEGIGGDDAVRGEHGAPEEAYDRTRLRNEVSRALSQRRNVTFTAPTPAPTSHAPVVKGTPPNTTTTPVRQAPSSSSPSSALLRPTDIKFSTPPNSPNNMSVMAAHNGAPGGTKVAEKKPPMAQQRNGVTCTEREKQNKIETNRFKRLQIQWELLSKEAHGRAAAESQRRMEIRSGGNTPTGGTGGINGATKSRIPRPVSYPTTRTNSDPVVSKTLKSPSRIAPPRRYPGVQSPQTHGGTTTTVTTPPTPAPRTPSRTYGNITTTTPKKVSSVPSRIPLMNRGRKLAIK